MNQIILPFCPISVHINPIAFHLFGVPIYWYAIFIVASLGIAMFAYYKNDKKFGIHYDDIIDLSLILIPISFICARIYYVVFNLENYTNFAQMLNIKDGGLAIYGGIIGGAITAYLFCKKRNLSFLSLADYIIPYVSLGQAIGRWGNFVNVEAYGGLTNLPWKMGIYTKGGIQYVHPTFLYESIADFLIFLVLIKLSKNRKYEGQLLLTYVISYSFIRFLIEGLRVDSLMLGPFRISQIVSGILFIVAIFCVICLKKKQK